MNCGHHLLELGQHRRVDRVVDRYLAVERPAPASSSTARARRANSTEITGSYSPCTIAIGGNGDSRSGSQPSTVGMKPLSAMSAAGRGRPLPSPSA